MTFDTELISISGAHLDRRQPTQDEQDQEIQTRTTITTSGGITYEIEEEVGQDEDEENMTTATSINITSLSPTSLSSFTPSPSPDNDHIITRNNNRHHHPDIDTSNNNHANKHDRLTEAQLDQLGTLIKIIREGDYNEFLELLETKGFKSLLNVFVDGQTVLHYSLIYGRSLAWCKQLILNGANPNLTNRAGWHPIHLAAFNGSRETMRYLIDCIAA